MKIAFAALTDVGRVRKNNEDTYLIFDIGAGERLIPPPPSGEGEALTNGQGVLFAVADGMGGAAAGEVASKMAVETLADRVGEINSEDTDDEVCEKIKSAILRANERIFEASLANPRQRGMGTTLTVAYIRKGRVQFFQVGDSKGFIFVGRVGQLHQMTQDQSLIGKLIEDKVITPEDAEQLEGGRNIILQALGAEARVGNIDHKRSVLAEGDQVMLCTDGLHGCIKKDRLEEMVKDGRDTGKLCEDLVRAACDAGGPDNVTVITVTMLEGDEETRSPGLLGRLAAMFKKQ